MPSRISAQIRRMVWNRAEGCCEYCRSQARFATQAFSIEHIIPRKAGGTNEATNLALACQGCNNHKYTKTRAVDPITLAQAPLFHPRQDIWGNHFAWNETYTLIVGLTPTGRATVHALKLNRAGLINLRHVLFQMGEHPPLSSDE